MPKLTETQESCRNDFLHDWSQALAVTPASISQVLAKEPSLLALACTYKRLPKSKPEAKATATEAPAPAAEPAK